MISLSRNYAFWVGQLAAYAEVLANESNATQISHDLKEALESAAIGAKNNAEAILRMLENEE